MAKKRSNSMNTYINIITSVGVMVVNLFISFWLSPYIIRTIGVEANGFVSLANNFVTYANLIVTALNAMAARFITIAYVQKDYKRANMYYNSVFWGNLIIVAVLLIPSVYLVVKLEDYIDVPTDILLDVKILFSLVFLSFFVRTGAPNYDCGTYITNRMDLSYIPNMFTSLLRCVMLVSMFIIWTPHVWYVSCVSFVLGLITLGIAGYYTHKLTPELRVSIRKPICAWNALKELIGSGIWSAIASSGNMLLTGLDLLLCNLYIGATEMGILSISKTLPSILIQFSESIRGAFGPELTIAYAQGNKEALLATIKKAMRITTVIVTLPAAGIVIMSDVFYSLWVPSQNAEILQTLTTLSILSYLVNSGIVALFGVFSAVNRVKDNSIAMIVSGICSIFVTLLLILNSDWDLYAVAGVSSVMTILKNMIFTIPAASYYLGVKWYAFYPQVGQSVLACTVIIGIGWVVRQILPVHNWLMFFVASGIIAALGLAANMMIVLNKSERAYLMTMVKRKLHLK
jgi:O-antigen/teichoic acid export membrane protein